MVRFRVPGTYGRIASIIGLGDEKCFGNDTVSVQSSKAVQVYGQIDGRDREVITVHNEDTIFLYPTIQFYPTVAKALSLRMYDKYGLVYVGRGTGDIDGLLTQESANRAALFDSFDNIADRIDRTAKEYAAKLSLPWNSDNTFQETCLCKDCRQPKLHDLIQHIERGDISKRIVRRILEYLEPTSHNMAAYVRYMLHMNYTNAHDSVSLTKEQYSHLSGDMQWHSE